MVVWWVGLFAIRGGVYITCTFKIKVYIRGWDGSQRKGETQAYLGVLSNLLIMYMGVGEMYTLVLL